MAVIIDGKEVSRLTRLEIAEEVAKFKDIKYIQDQSAIYIEDAKVLMKAQVVEIVHFKDIEDDNFIVFNVLSYSEDSKKKFLSL